MKPKRKGKIVLLHMAGRYPFGGFFWHLIHHLVGFQRLGIEVYCLEDHGAYVYDPIARSVVAGAERNLAAFAAMLARHGFAGRWAFLDPAGGEYVGMSRERCRGLLREADAVINLCGATSPREEHTRNRCLAFVETDPGGLQAAHGRGDTEARWFLASHKVFFSYACNIGTNDCLLPTLGVQWHPTRPPVLLDQWCPAAQAAEPRTLTTIGTWRHGGSGVEINGRGYQWSKHRNFAAVLTVARRASQPIELATDLIGGDEYERARAAGFVFRPAVPMSIDAEAYRRYISSSRGEFTVVKEVYAATRSGWFSDRSACYLAAGRPVVTQSTGFEKYLPTGVGLLGFNDAAGAVEAIRAINADYPTHARAAREIACEYFDAMKVLDRMAETLGL